MYSALNYVPGMILNPFYTLSHLVLETKPVGNVLLLSLFYRLGSYGLKRLNNLHRIIVLVSFCE